MTQPLSKTSPSQKRSRTDIVEPLADSGEWKQHPELYMPDGTMVFLANDTLFRVYPGLLSKHSDVFKGMASLSECQPPNAETYHGCPLVRLTDDAEDLASFLEATMGLKSFHINQPTPFRFAAAILRLATKYMVAPLRRQAIEHFSRIIPKKFNDIGKEESHRQVFGDDPPHPFALVSLFRESQATHFLPWAFYLACQADFDKLVSGASYNGKDIHLSEEDRSIALLGWKHLRDTTLKIRHTTVMSQAPDCNSGDCNTSLRVPWLDTTFYSVRSDTLEQWKFFNLLSRVGENSTRLQIAPCAPCIASWLASEKSEREKIWNNLPQTFGLPVWEELYQEEQNMEEAA